MIKLKSYICELFFRTAIQLLCLDVWCAYLLRPLIPEDPLARHCSLSLSTGSEHLFSWRLALISISRSCLEVPAIADGPEGKGLLFKELGSLTWGTEWIKRINEALTMKSVGVSLGIFKCFSSSGSEKVGLRGLQCHWNLNLNHSPYWWGSLIYTKLLVTEKVNRV